MIRRILDWIRSKLRRGIEHADEATDKMIDDEEDEESKQFSVVKRYR